MRSAFAVAAVLFALTNDAQEQRPDFSRDALRRTFSAHAIDLPERPGPRFRFRVGAVDFYAFGMDWRLFYLPIAMPLSGSTPGVSNQFPDPFVLTQTSIASPKRSWHTVRARNAELRRIERTERSRSRLGVQSQ